MLVGLVLYGTGAAGALAAQAAPAAEALPPEQDAAFVPLTVREGVVVAPVKETTLEFVPAEPLKVLPPPPVVQVFVEACVAHGGAVTPAVDWALNHGFEPLDTEGQDGTDGYALLDGRPGVVFATSDPATRVLLAVTQDGNCIAWAERAIGTSTQDAFIRAAEALALDGAKLRRETDRMIERAGAWRRQLEYRLQPAGSRQDYRIGAVTTLTDAPAAQALRLAPLSPAQLSRIPNEARRESASTTSAR